MADQRLPQKDQKITPQDDFKIHVVDPNDLSVHPTGKSFWMERGDFLGALFDSVFTSLTDVPNTYSGQGLKTVQVNAAENALVFEFANFLALNDVTETTFTGKQGQIVKVNSTPNGLEFAINSFINLADVSETTLEFQQGKFVYVDADLTTEPATYSLKFQNLPTYETFYGANALILGGITYRGTGLNYTVWAEKYIINGRYLETPIAAEVTNSNGDPTFDRFDVYYIEIDNSDPPIPSIGILEGTPSASPLIPTLDLTNQVQVGIRLIAANETVDPDAVTETVFDDNTGEPTEWTNILLPAGANLASLVAPKVGVSSALFPAYLTPSIVSWQNDVQWTFVAEESLIFYIKPATTFAPQASFEFQLKNTVTSEYWVLTLTPQTLTNYGYNQGVSDWQLIQIGLSNFVTGSRSATEYNTVQITLNRTPILGIDWLVIQGGVSNPSDTSGLYVKKRGDVMDEGAFLEFNSGGLKSEISNQSATKVFTTDGAILDLGGAADFLHGWGNYQDAATAPATQTITTTPSKVQIDGAGSASSSLYLPKEIRGSSELWDTTNDKITPISLGDAYSIRIGINITAKTGSPTSLTLKLDIGGGAAPTVVIVTRDIGTLKTPPYDLSVAFPIFCLATFIANGGQVFLQTDTGTITMGARSIYIERTYKGSL